MALQFFDSQEAAWKNMTIAISGANLIKIRGLRYSVEKESEHLFAAGDEAISIQEGNMKIEGSLKILKGALDDFNEVAVAAGARNLTDVEFDINVAYLPSLDGTRVLRNDTIIRCKISKLEKGWDQGAKMMEIDLPFKALSLKQS